MCWINSRFNWFDCQDSLDLIHVYCSHKDLVRIPHKHVNCILLPMYIVYLLHIKLPVDMSVCSFIDIKTVPVLEWEELLCTFVYHSDLLDLLPLFHPVSTLPCNSDIAEWCTFVYTCMRDGCSCSQEKMELLCINIRFKGYYLQNIQTTNTVYWYWFP